MDPGELKLSMNCSPAVCTLIPNSPCFFVDLRNSFCFQARCKFFTGLALRHSMILSSVESLCSSWGQQCFIINNRAHFIEFSHNKYLKQRLLIQLRASHPLIPVYCQHPCWCVVTSILIQAQQQPVLTLVQIVLITMLLAKDLENQICSVCIWMLGTWKRISTHQGIYLFQIF